MAIQILLPALPPSTPPARLVRWRVAVGQQVAVGDVIAEIACGQLTIEVESTFAGRIERILVPEDTWAIPPNAAIALLSPDDRPSIAPTPSGADAWQPLQAASSAADVRNSAQLASPRARELAHAHSIDLRAIKGSGPDGRIVSRDIEALLAGKTLHERESEHPGASPTAQRIKRPIQRQTAPPAKPRTPEVTHVSAAPNATSRASVHAPAPPPQPTAAQTIVVRADELDPASREVPCARLTIDCFIDALVRWRLDRDTLTSDAFVLPSATSPAVVFTKALGLALADIPAANVTWTPQGPQRQQTADVAFAVLVPELQMTPIIRNVDTRSLDDIAHAVIDLTRRAQDGSLDPSELEGGAVSILDLGTYGIRTFEPVLEPPRSISLSLGARDQRPVIVDGELRSASIITCSLSCDIRAVPVAVAAELLATIKALVEEPTTLLTPRPAPPSF